MRTIAIIVMVIIIILVGFLIYWLLVPTEPVPSGAVACTMEAKICSDGSYVGRVGPNCEFAACPGATSTPVTATTTQGIAPYKSGVHGVVLVGPTCPVVRNPPDPQCADKPFQTLVVLFRASDPVHAFAFAQSGGDGTFSFSVPPGQYTLGAGESNLPQCDHSSVIVPATGYVTTTISCDTGIR